MDNKNFHDVRFIADVMLGRLSRWLRLLGFDTLYYPDIKDGDLMKLAVRENRYLLTRDTHFMHIRNFRNFLMVSSDDPIEQVREVLSSFILNEFKPGRCARCNGMLDAVVRREEARNMVPEYVFLHCDSFLRCRVCGNVYWEGTHLVRFRTMLNPVLMSLKRKGLP
ncbi:MAG TPA: Mut7-C RNAse domain-containing protein [Thermodesulfovibrionales bacterium]|nr:Mut7-C RNAse domain-containing protein [Thermodesulfovibrionales bacterium]